MGGTVIEGGVLCLPVLLLTVTGLVILLFFHRRDASGESYANLVAGLGFIATLITLLLVRPSDGPVRAFDGFLLGDEAGFLAAFACVAAGLVTVFCLGAYLEKMGSVHAEIPALLVFATAGMLILVMTDHFATFFIGLETMSLALYALSACLRGEERSLEAGVKYLLTGAFASGILLMGLAFIYGATGSLSLVEIGAALDPDGPRHLLSLAGLLLVLVGIGFKLGLVPFHQWAPDVYEGAPTPITGFMATTVKLVTFLALLRVVGGFSALSDDLVSALSWLGAITMTVGNLGALAQTSVKRMLAYSSVSHAGYILLGVVVASAVPDAGGREAVLFYLVVYTAMNLGAFGVLGAIETRQRTGLTFDELGGLKTREPWLAGCLLLFMLSLAGIPPTAGFLAKWKIFEALVGASEVLGTTAYVLLGFLIVNSVVGLAYYLRVVVAMYMSPSPDPVPIFPLPPRLTLIAVLVCAFLTLWLGFGPTIFGIGAESLLTWVHEAF